MKKTSKAMRVAAALAIATAMSTCVVAGTFAKYTATGGGSDTARVAKWGVTGTSYSTGDLFKTTYTNATNGETVKSSDYVIAPGTNGSATFGLTVQDSPEVAYTFKVDTNGSAASSGIKDDSSIKWKLDGELAGTNGTWDELMTALSGLSEAGTVAPGGLPAANGTHTVSWDWAFEGQDAKDTALGNDAVSNTVKLIVNVTATQVD